MGDAAEDVRQFDIDRYLRAVLRPGELVVEVGARSRRAEALSRDAGIRLVSGNVTGLDDMEAHAVPRLLWLTAELDAEQALSETTAVLQLHRPLVVTEASPRGGVDRLLQTARPLGYPVALRSSDPGAVLLIHERDVIDALEARPQRTDLASENDVWAARIAEQTQQLRRLEAEVFSLKHRVEDGAVGAAQPSRQPAEPGRGSVRRAGGSATLKRKYRKLMANPRRFFEDSQSPFVREVVGRFYLTVAAGRGHLR